MSKLHCPHGTTTESGNKLRTYCLVKQNHRQEPYLQTIGNTKISANISKLRMGSHCLNIETGRFVKPKKIPADQRFCPKCPTLVEDEIHFLTECSLYRDLRNKLFRSIDAPENFFSMPNKDQFKYLLNFTLNNSREAAVGLCHYTNRAFARRKKLQLGTLPQAQVATQHTGSTSN